MNIKQNLVKSSKYKIKCPYAMTPKYITIHNTLNNASAKNEISYMIGNDTTTSFHIAVDDKEAIQGIPFNRNAFHAGDGKNGTGNRHSIGIEICYSYCKKKVNGKWVADDEKWKKQYKAKHDKAVKNAIELTAQLMKQFNIPASKIYYHNSWSGKYCPHRLLDEGVTLKKFRDLVQAKYDEMYVKKAEKPAEKPAESFLPSRGYFKRGDSGDQVKKINDFYYKIFPSYAKTLKRNVEDVKGNYFGENTEAWTKEFQRRTKLEADGYIGKLTLNMLKKYGFKE